VDDEGEDDGEPVVVPIEDALDLHPFAPRDIPSVVEELFESFHKLRGEIEGIAKSGLKL
jgi:hypothetical protein